MKQNLLPLHYSERYRLLKGLEYRTSPCGDDNINTYFWYYINDMTPTYFLVAGYVIWIFVANM